jgi:hypothetical protein
LNDYSFTSARAENPPLPSRRVLKSVAHDVSESLVSRNDDLGGYWTLGQLLSHALATGNTRYKVDLVCGESTPILIGTPLSSLPSSWAETFWKNVEHKKLPRALVPRAVAILNFDLTKRRAAPLHGGLVEYAFSTRVEIEDDRARTYAATTEGWCFPHDPALELKSARRLTGA